MVLEFSNPTNRVMGKYLDDELRTLADLYATEWIPDDYRNPENEHRRHVLVSLERFHLAWHVSVDDAGQYRGWGWIISDAGAEEVERRQPRNNYGGGCTHLGTIQMPCVCRIKTYCPEGHPGNGCHGSHD